MLLRFYDRYGKTRVQWVIGGIAILCAVIIVLQLRGDDAGDTTSDTQKVPVVTLEAVRDFGSESSFSVVGTVRAVREAKLQAETGGRVTAVYVHLGDTVSAGTILGAVENSREHAALLQAEGAYDAAVASSRGGRASLDEAKVAVRNTYRDTFSTADSIVRNLIDDFYSNPGESLSGFKLDSAGSAAEFNDTRRYIEGILDTWSEHITNDFSGLTETDMLTSAERNITTISNLTARLAFIVSEEDPNTQFSASDLAAYSVSLTGARASLDGALSAISGTRRAYEQTVISASPETTSQSSALLKSALGALRTAQANYERTLVRTPISGTVNALYLKEGEYVTSGQAAAIVANNGSLEITTAVGEKDLAYLTIGDTVLLNNTASGTITKVAPAVDPTTGKSEVLISADDTLSLKNGSTVSVTFTQHEQVVEDAEVVPVVPLKALKMLASGPVAFGVNEEHMLVSYPVTLGAIRGDAVEIVDGLTLDSVIITDARGLKEGDVVTVTQ